ELHNITQSYVSYFCTVPNATVEFAPTPANSAGTAVSKELTEEEKKIKTEKYNTAISELEKINPKIDELKIQHESLLSTIKSSEEKLEGYQPKTPPTDGDGYDDNIKKYSPDELIQASLDKTQSISIEKVAIEEEIERIKNENPQTEFDEKAVTLSSDETRELTSLRQILVLTGTKKNREIELVNKLLKMKRDEQSQHTKKTSEIKDQLAKEEKALLKINSSLQSEETKRNKIADLVSSLKEMQNQANILMGEFKTLEKSKLNLESIVQTNKSKEPEVTNSSSSNSTPHRAKEGVMAYAVKLNAGRDDEESDAEDNNYESDDEW
ncbi:MAG: hypothetical protein V4482_04630, partial [Pseudomonadota bacterium]